MPTNSYHPPEAWRCNACGDAYEDEDDAIKCCRPTITEGYFCPVCRRFHCDEDAAVACCDYDPDAPPPPPSAAELEQAGQMRLLP